MPASGICQTLKYQSHSFITTTGDTVPQNSSIQSGGGSRTANVIILNNISEWMMGKIYKSQEDEILGAFWLHKLFANEMILLGKFLYFYQGQISPVQTSTTFFENMEHNSKVPQTLFRTKVQVFKRETPTFLLTRRTTLDTRDNWRILNERFSDKLYFFGFIKRWF